MSYVPKGDEAGSKDGYGEPMPCSVCRGWSTRGDLMMYGSRCQRCYGKWCESAFDEPHAKPTNSSKPSGKDVLRNLQTFTERHGRKLGEAQKHVLAALEKQYAPQTLMVPD